MSVLAVQCANGTKDGRACKRWVSAGSECPYHGVPFDIRYPDPDDPVNQAVLREWRRAS